MKARVALLALLALALNAAAGTGGQGVRFASDAFEQSVVWNQLNVAPTWALKAACEEQTGFSAYSAVAGQENILYEGVVGTHADFTCTGPGPEYVVVPGFTVWIVPACIEGTASVLNYSTTITAIDEFGTMTPAGPNPNPQCVNNCVSKHETGSPNMACNWYINPTETHAPGQHAWISCTTNIAFTGEVCNTTMADFQNMTVNATKPMGFISADDNDGEGDPGEGGGGSTEAGSATSAGQCGTVEKPCKTEEKMPDKQDATDGMMEYLGEAEAGMADRNSALKGENLSTFGEDSERWKWSAGAFIPASGAKCSMEIQWHFVMGGHNFGTYAIGPSYCEYAPYLRGFLYFMMAGTTFTYLLLLAYGRPT